GRRREHHVDAPGRATPGVLLERARVALEVVAPVELDRVHEDRDHDALRPPPRLGDQRQVAVVERAHRRDERDALARGAPRLGPRLHGAGRGDGLHQPATAFAGLNACASVGKAPAFTSPTYAHAARTTSRPTSA